MKLKNKKEKKLITKQDLYNHTNYINDDGDEVPSVTTVLKILNKNLDGWANYIGMKGINLKNYLEDVSRTGTLTHYLISRAIDNKIIPLFRAYESSDPVSVYSGLMMFNNWKKKYNVEFIESEIKLTCDEYGGTVDCICKIGGEVYIVDFKTSSSVQKSMFIQLAAYKHLVQKLLHIKVDKVAILCLPRKGNKGYTFKVKDVDKIGKYEKIFKLLLELYNIY